MFFNVFRFQLFVLLTLSNFISLNAANYNDDIINIYSKMLPRFVIMSSQQDKIDNEIRICILHDELDERVAQTLQDKIESNYPDGLKNYPIKLIQTSFDRLKECENVQLAFLFDSDAKQIDQTMGFFKKNTILTISYNMSFLEQGADMSLFIGRNVVPYINMKSIRDKHITLDYLLIRVSKIYVDSEK